MIPIKDNIPSRTTPIVTYALIALSVLAFSYERRLLAPQLEHLVRTWGFVPGYFRADLRDRLADEPLPVILSGDFNFTDRSPNADLLHHLGLVDSHALAGFGRGSTWPVHSFFRYVPGIRLDHIYLSRSLNCSQSRTGTGLGSDHRPIVARISAASGAVGS